MYGAACILSLVVCLMGAEDTAQSDIRQSLRKEFDWAFYSIRWNSLVREHDIPAVALEDVSPLWCALHCWATDNGEQLPTIKPKAFSRLKGAGVNGLYIDARPFRETGYVHEIGFTDEILRELKELHDLEYIWFVGLRLTREQVEYLSGMTSLKRVLLVDSGVSFGDVVRGLGTKRELTQIAIIDSADQKKAQDVTVGDIETLAENFPKLQELHFWSSVRIEPAAANRLAMLKTLKRLVILPPKSRART